MNGLTKPIAIQSLAATECLDYVNRSLRVTAYKAVQILNILNTNKFVTSKYRTLSNGGNREELDVFVMAPACNNSITINFECSAKTTDDNTNKLQTYHFKSHPFFESIISYYSRTKDKPNPMMELTRPWDVAVNMIIKVEALEPTEQGDVKNITLRREFEILNHIWNTYINSGWDYEDITGIPLVFEYRSVNNDLFNFYDLNSKYIDKYGTLSKMTVDKSGFDMWQNSNFSGAFANPRISYMVAMTATGISSLSYMTMEKLGPNIRYLMQLQSHALPTAKPIFSCDTSFKIFDQLICRLIQLHRAKVVHHYIAPQNIHFGRCEAVNIVYLAHFKAAICVDQDAHSLKHRNVNNDRYCSLAESRLASPHPTDDLENAFYVLLSMLAVQLPWDISAVSSDLSRFKSAPHLPNNNNIPVPENINNNDELQHGTINVGSMTADTYYRLNSHVKTYVNTTDNPFSEDTYRTKCRDIKAAFWKSPLMMKRLLTNIEHEHNRGYSEQESSFHTQLACEILFDLYNIIKDIISSFSNKRNARSFCKSLKFGNTIEMDMYNNIRRCILLYYRFDDLQNEVLFSSGTFQMKNQMVANRKSCYRLAWNLAAWCFSHVDVSTPSRKDMCVTRRSKFF